MNNIKLLENAQITWQWIWGRLL